MMGPVTTAPNCFWSSSGFWAPGRTKKFLASRASFRPNAKSVAWNSLVPLLLTRFTWLALNPYSAEYVLVCSLNSAMASMDRMAAGVPRDVSMFDVPSIMKLFEVGREPMMLIAFPTPWRIAPCSPVASTAPAPRNRSWR
jgi:hypothetical protein